MTLILVALECPEKWDGLRKVRVPAPTLSSENTAVLSIDRRTCVNPREMAAKATIKAGNAGADAEGVMLEQAILKECAISSLISSLNYDDDTTAHYEIEVYDNKSHAFVRLDTVAHVAALGTKLRASLKIRHSDQDESDGKHSTVLAITGRYFPYDPETGIVAVRLPAAHQHQSKSPNSFESDESEDISNGDAHALDSRIIELVVKEKVNAGLGTGLNVWDGSLLLARFLERHSALVKDKRILELGAGCGVVALVSAALGAKHVVMTDLPYTMDLMQSNTDRNAELIFNHHNHHGNASHQSPVVECDVCDWFHPEQSSSRVIGSSSDDRDRENASSANFDLIVVADCVWLEQLVVPLMNTLRFLVNRQTKDVSPPSILLSYQRRGKATHELFVEQLHTYFDVTYLDVASATTPFDDDKAEHSGELSIPDEKFFLISCTAKELRDERV
jgi:predicted nicotinamide N-methyase